MPTITQLESGILIKAVELNGKPVIIGRGSDNDIVLNNLFVSRRQAAIEEEGGNYYLKDLNSKNGTYLNGQKIGALAHQLALQDKITFVDPIKNPAGTTLVFGDLETLDWIATGGCIPAQAAPSDNDFSLDLDGDEIIARGQALKPRLQGIPFAVLGLLWERRGKVCSRKEIALVGWPDRPDDVSATEIHTCVMRIKHYLSSHEIAPEFVDNVRGKGYKLLLAEDLPKTCFINADQPAEIEGEDSH